MVAKGEARLVATCMAEVLQDIAQVIFVEHFPQPSVLEIQVGSSTFI